MKGEVDKAIATGEQSLKEKQCIRGLRMTVGPKPNGSNCCLDRDYNTNASSKY
jgi:hypothetical protein